MGLTYAHVKPVVTYSTVVVVVAFSLFLCLLSEHREHEQRKDEKCNQSYCGQRLASGGNGGRNI